jgi:uridine kinase
MKGDVVIINENHIQSARAIVSQIIEKIRSKPSRFVITVAGESGSGKSETGFAIANELKEFGIKSVVLGQDDYFYLPPKLNSEKRKADPDWLGPHKEVNFETFEQNLFDGVRGSSQIVKPSIDYNQNTVGSETIDLYGVKVIIAEGTYTSLLKYVDIRIFIARDWIKTLEHRRERNRGNEINDVFTENILAMEHKIIAGHKFLADFVIDDDYQVISVESEFNHGIKE